ncbi:type VI secretion system baseplate subunit TssF [Sphingobacterium sp. Mn56C]|uniref:type VI secretion system baseplate subunit TssF n=1 Tax=Sphingobacterium sp. Mn56C TaxID=3395261 RepID=UPI003BD0D876
MINEKTTAYSKEAIKERMLRNAVKIWGLKSSDNMDPLVSLLIDAFAMEIFKVNHEIQNADSRVLEKLAKLLTPSIYTHPQPGHALAYCYPNDSIMELPAYSEFFIKKQIPSFKKSEPDNQVDIHFTPVDKVRLVKMKTAVMITAGCYFTFTEGSCKTVLAKLPSTTLRPNKIMLGIDATDFSGDHFPTKLALYCTNPTHGYIDFVYKLLPFISVTAAGELLEVTAGLSYCTQKSTAGYLEIFSENSLQKLLEENIKNTYKDKFIEISGLKASLLTGLLPPSLHFMHDLREAMAGIEGKQMLWLEMEFPPQYTHDILAGFSFSLNAFPIYNRKWKSKEYALNVMADNIPMSTAVGEHFLFVDKVEDNFGHVYSEIPFQNTKEVDVTGQFTVRKGGMERFNDRNALDMTANLLELTRDEVSAFGVLDRDKVVEAIRKMTNQMRVLDKRVSQAEKTTMQEINYAIVSPFADTEYLKAAYWVSNCTLANNIPMGTCFTQPRITEVITNQSITLLTPTTGGNEAQKGTNAIQAYKYALTTRNKLISMEDIKSFCFLLVADDIAEIQVKRGTIISSKPKEGFIKTIEVEITPKAYNRMGTRYWNNLAETLKHQIMLRGIDGIEYIVRVIDGDHETGV